MLYIPDDVKIGDIVSPLPQPVVAKYHHTQEGKTTTVAVYSVKSETEPDKRYVARVVRYKGVVTGVSCTCPAHARPLPPFRPRVCKHVAAALAKDLLRHNEGLRYGLTLMLAEKVMTPADKRHAGVLTGSRCNGRLG